MKLPIGTKVSVIIPAFTKLFEGKKNEWTIMDIVHRQEENGIVPVYRCYNNHDKNKTMYLFYENEVIKI
jgi:hypothetical protein